ncbi:hypothetical protein, partial [Pantoea vagans]|uniref:hypothetical protein n=1 Tax=Pantoea vagans TaxID=470934 RepID=UPI001C9CEFE0
WVLGFGFWVLGFGFWVLGIKQICSTHRLNIKKSLFTPAFKSISPGRVYILLTTHREQSAGWRSL